MQRHTGWFSRRGQLVGNGVRECLGLMLVLVEQGVCCAARRSQEVADATRLEARSSCWYRRV